MVKNMQYFCVLFLCSFITLFCIGDDGYGAESVTAKANLQKLIKTNSCRGCDLSGVNLNRVDLSDADLEGADLSKAKMYLTNLSRANLRNADLRGVVFGGADLADADLRGADLRGTALDGAYLGGTLLDGKFVITKPYEKDGISEIEREVYIDDPSKPKPEPKTKEIVVAPRRVFEEPPPTLPEKKVDEKVVKKEDYPQAPEVKKPTLLKNIVIEEELSTEKNAGDSGPVEIDLNRGRGAENQNLAAEKKKRDNAARLFDTKKCYDCDLSGMDLSNRNLGGADLEKSNLTGANLEKADLRGANLKGVLLIQANLRGANLKKADFYRADLTGADLTGAHTENTLFDSADFSGSTGLSSDVMSKEK
jgi:uncharacterized protein YjbI with pentapeptide repeats